MILCICGGIGEGIIVGLIALFGLCGICIKKKLKKNCKCHGLESPENPLDQLGATDITTEEKKDEHLRREP